MHLSLGMGRVLTTLLHADAGRATIAGLDVVRDAQAVRRLIGLSMAWIGVYLGLAVPTVEVAQQLGFLVIFPITFLSNAFVPIATLPAGLQPIAEWNPVSALTQATRELFGNPSPYATDSFPGEHPIFMSVVWTIALLAVFMPLAIRKYRAIDR